MFIGRVKELAALMKAYRHEGFRLLELYGAAGAGKTTLLEEFCRNKDAIIFSAFHENLRVNLDNFSMTLFAHYKDYTHTPFKFWSDAFDYVAEKQEGRKVILALDNFHELTDRDAVFMNTLMKCIADGLKDSSIFLILSSRRKAEIDTTSRITAQLLQRYSAGSLKLDKFTLPDDVVSHIKRQQTNGAKMLKFAEDEVILREGETNTEMFKIVAGRALCYFGYGTDDEYLIGTLKEGHTFGEYSLLTGRPGIYTVAAYTDMLLLRIGQDEFTDFISMNASNAVEMMQNLARVISVLKVNIDMLRDESGGVE